MHVYPPHPMANVAMKSRMAGIEDQQSAAPNIDFKKIRYQFEVQVVFGLK
jgi:hypothetical protein